MCLGSYTSAHFPERQHWRVCRSFAFARTRHIASLGLGFVICLTHFLPIALAILLDTSNSMGGEINEMKAIANKFAADLKASNIDYQLGLVEFRDFPQTCGEGDKTQCGSPGDSAYRILGNGTLTSDIYIFSSWLKELKAGGGGSVGPEAVLAALRHADSDSLWRNGAERVIIVLTDAGPHPDGSCCNAEGDTLDGTIFALADWVTVSPLSHSILPTTGACSFVSASWL